MQEQGPKRSAAFPLSADGLRPIVPAVTKRMTGYGVLVLSMTLTACSSSADDRTGASSTAPSSTSIPTSSAIAPVSSTTEPAASSTAAAAQPARRTVQIQAGEHEVGTPQGAGLPLSGLKKHRATVAAFELDATEVTVRAFAACVAAKACELANPVEPDPLCNWGKAGRDEHPMNCVSFAMADAFCSWEHKRLPTEIEWEVAAAGDLVHPTALPYDEGALDVCLTSELSSYGPPPRADHGRAVGTCAVIDKPKADSKLGLVDMMGNVSEWTTSRFCEAGPDCDERVLRGTAWLGDLYESFRNRWRGPAPAGLDKGQRIPSQIGLRCARDVPPSR